MFGKFFKDCGIKLSSENERLGRRLEIPRLKSNGRQAIQTLREQTLQINGARLFNIIPREIREIQTSKEDFKTALDKFLETIPDHPRMGLLVPGASNQITGRQDNSLLAWIRET